MGLTFNNAEEEESSEDGARVAVENFPKKGDLVLSGRLCYEHVTISM
jgi:hypothetical protein